MKLWEFHKQACGAIYTLKIKKWIVVAGAVENSKKIQTCKIFMNFWYLPQKFEIDFITRYNSNENPLAIWNLWSTYCIFRQQKLKSNLFSDLQNFRPAKISGRTAKNILYFDHGITMLHIWLDTVYLTINHSAALRFVNYGHKRPQLRFWRLLHDKRLCFDV